MQESKMFEYDELKMYFGEPYNVTDKIVIYQPSLGDIIEFGEKEFYSIIYMLCGNTTLYRMPLWDIGIDWNEFSDFELFVNNVTKLDLDKTKLLFGDLDFTKFKPVFENEVENESFKMVYELDEEIQIDELVYVGIVDYLRRMFDFYPKVELARNKATKEAMIDEDRMNAKIRENRRKKGELKSESTLFPLISSMVNHPGFKYKKNELKEVGIVEFMDSVKRLQTYESVKSLMNGMYSGMMDLSKIDMNKELNWTRDIYSK